MQNTFNKELFTQVISANLETFNNIIMFAAETKAIKTGKSVMTDDETMDLANKYFTHIVSKCLADRTHV